MLAVHQGKEGGSLIYIGQSTGLDVTASGYFPYMYILYLRHKGAILVTPCMSLPISTTTAYELLKNLKL